jgi:glycosyltransferase involved in cell wall biosynthesis
MAAPAFAPAPLAAQRLRRLLLLLPSAAFGGTERHALALARMLQAAGVAVTILADPERHAALAREAGPRLAPCLRGARIAWDAAETPAENIRRQRQVLEALLPATRADAALLPLPWPNAGLGLQAVLAERGLPTLVIGHLAPPETPPGLDAAAPAAPRHLPGLWAAVSAPVAARLEAAFGLPAGRVQVVPNGVPLPPGIDAGRRAALRAELRAGLDLPPEGLVALFLGRLEPVKGAELLPYLAQAFARRGGAALLAAGTGPLEARLQAALPGGRSALRLLGQQADPGRLLLAADALVLPSRLEGFPLVFLEAAGRRCPVVASPAALECLGDTAGDHAALAEAEDVAGLAEALMTAATRAAPTPARLAAAAALARRQDEAAMLDRYRDLLRTLPGLAAAA